ncbi:MAG: M20/M25/M40 family metallo-hydrolase [Gemmatimonadetes bacterium]|nr:M20/M25/M40 family metallo-hydrolase [Gemmatimonadota bacterium]
MSRRRGGRGAPDARVRPTVALACAIGALGATPALAQRALDADGLEALKDESVELVRDYIRVNTVNPPGNETRAVEFFARIFDAEGIAYETAESAPGRGNIWARIEGGDEPAVILLHHTDVVPADADHWTADPLGAEVRDGLIYGRGALDTKTLGILHLQAFLALHRSGTPLDRDIIFMATADEEAGGLFGAGWLVENRSELFEDVGYVLNEGGGGTVSADRVDFGIEVTQKVPVWLRLVATGTPGHGSMPRAESSVTKLVRALDRLRQYRFAPRILEPVDTYFKGIAEAAGEEWSAAFADMEHAVQDPELLARLQLENPFLAAITRNTCSLTRLEASDKINVVPPSASAEIDCRVLPDQDVDAFRAEIRSVLNDSAIEIETVMAFTPAISSTDTDVYRALETVTRARYEDASVLPSVAAGFTDSHFFRDIDIHAYGYSPMAVPEEDSPRLHGNDERISIENVRRGTEIMLEILERIAVTPVP